MDQREFDEMLRSLVAAIQHQGTIKDDLWTCLQEQRTMNQRVEGFSQQ